MKLLLLLSFLLSTQAFGFEVDVLSAEFGVEDYENRKTLCLTVVRVPQSGKVLGVVESIEDCFYARTAKKAPAHKISIPMNKLQKITEPLMKEHLQFRDPNLEFYYSGE